MAFWLAGCFPQEEEEEEVSVSAPSTTWYQDADGDGYGNPAIEVVGVDDPSAPGDLWSDNDTDCDDANANANSGELEIADRVDNDCDGEVDNGFKYAFATSSTHPGNLGGLTGADTICQHHARKFGMDFVGRSRLRTIQAPVLYPEVTDELTGGQFTFIHDSKVELSKLSP